MHFKDLTYKLPWSPTVGFDGRQWTLRFSSENPELLSSVMEGVVTLLNRYFDVAHATDATDLDACLDYRGMCGDELCHFMYEVVNSHLLREYGTVSHKYKWGIENAPAVRMEEAQEGHVFFDEA